MHAQQLHNTLSLPWPHMGKKHAGYVAPPQQVAAQPQALATEDGKILLDENGNAILI